VRSRSPTPEPVSRLIKIMWCTLWIISHVDSTLGTLGWIRITRERRTKVFDNKSDLCEISRIVENV